MKRTIVLSACLLSLALVIPATAQQKTSAQEPVLPYSPSLNLDSMDKSIDPCADFHQYSCGGWQRKNLPSIFAKTPRRH